MIGMLGAMMPYIMAMVMLSMIVKMLGLGGMVGGFWDFMSQKSIISDRRKGIVKNDGTDRLYLSWVHSCRAIPTIARRLLLDPQGDGDVSRKVIGRVIGISPGLMFTVILIRGAYFKRKLLLVPTDFLSALDRPDVRLRARGLQCRAELWWFAIPVRSSDYFKNLEEYWRLCLLFIQESMYWQMGIDQEGDRDNQLKNALRSEKGGIVSREIDNLPLRNKTNREVAPDEAESNIA